MKTDDINNKKAMKILAMETDDFFKIFLRDSFLVFANKETSFTFASNIKDFFKALENNLLEKPDIIFLCLSAPLDDGGKIKMLSGFEVLKSLKSSDNYKNIPVVIFSKYNENSLKRKAKKLGASQYLVKGECMPRDITNAVENMGNMGEVDFLEKRESFFQKIFKWK